MQLEPLRAPKPRPAHRAWLALLTAVMDLCQDKAELVRHSERSWASVTFAGSRHIIALAFTGAEAVEAGECFLATLPDHEFSIPRQIVADASIVSVVHTALPEERMECEIELLLLEDS